MAMSGSLCWVRTTWTYFGDPRSHMMAIRVQGTFTVLPLPALEVHQAAPCTTTPSARPALGHLAWCHPFATGARLRPRTTESSHMQRRMPPVISRERSDNGWIIQPPRMEKTQKSNITWDGMVKPLSDQAITPALWNQKTDHRISLGRCPRDHPALGQTPVGEKLSPKLLYPSPSSPLHLRTWQNSLWRPKMLVEKTDISPLESTFEGEAEAAPTPAQWHADIFTVSILPGSPKEQCQR